MRASSVATVATELLPSQEMVMGMVSGLAESLKQQPDNLEGWQRLIRSYAVLGNRSTADAAFADAMEAFRDQPEARSQLQSIAREVGLDP